MVDDVLRVDEEADEEELHGIFYAFVDFWQGYDELPDSQTMIPGWGMPTEELIQKQQVWAEREEALLRGGVEAIE